MTRDETSPSLDELVTSDPNVMGGRRVFRGTRVPVEKCTREICENSELNSLPNPAHGVKVEVQIMHRIQGAPGHLSTQKQVP